MYDQLSKPFDVIHDLKGKPYLTGEQVTSRLNEVLGFDHWSFRILEHGFSEEADELWVLGELTVWTEAASVARQQFGSQQHNRLKSNKQIIDYGFDLKGAATDSLKKCASLIGVGLYLLEKDGGTPTEPPKQEPAPEKRGFYQVLADMGYSREAVDSRSQRMFNNREPKQLNPTEKKQLVAVLEKEQKERASA